ncbi:MAG: hypothetical protein R2939_04760 [Kofleriaceae bacterium]
MSPWRRRDVLAGLGVGSMSALLWGCAPARRLAVAAPAEVDPADVHAWLVDAVERLTPRYPEVIASVERRRRRVVSPRGIDDAVTVGAVISVVDPRGRRRERATDVVTAAAVDGLVRELGGGQPRKPWSPPSTTIEEPPPPPRRLDAWQHAVRALGERLDQAAGGAGDHLAVEAVLDDDGRWIVGHDRALVSHARRQRLGLAVASWVGTRPHLARLVRGDRGTDRGFVVDDDELAAVVAAARALPSPGARLAVLDAEVVLTPPVAAALALALAEARPPVAAPEVALDRAIIVDDAGADVAYGGVGRDALGDLAVATAVLTDAGLAASPPARGRRHRPQPTSASAPAVGHVAWRPGTEEEVALAVGARYRLEEPRAIDVDPAAGVVTVLVERARGLAAGAATDELHGRVAWRVPLVALAAARRSRAVGAWIAPGAAPRSASAPTVRARGELRSVRG